MKAGEALRIRRRGRQCEGQSCEAGLCQTNCTWPRNARSCALAARKATINANERDGDSPPSGSCDNWPPSVKASDILRSRSESVFRIPFFLLFPIAATVQPWVELAGWTPAAGERQITPSSKCAALRALSGYEISILSASLMRAGTEDREYCRVLGYIQPDIELEVALPTSWQCRFLMIGNGGYAG